MVHMLSPGPSKTFHDYCSGIIWPSVHRLLQSVQQVDVVFDHYLHTSLKSETRRSHGSGQRIKVTLSTAIRGKFSKFLRWTATNSNCFSMIAKFLVAHPIGSKILICTVDDAACASHEFHDISALAACSAEEADGHLLLHAVKAGLCNITICTVDSDVVAIAIYAFTRMSGVKELWIDFSVSKTRKMIPVHEICANVPHAITINLPFFHAFTWCDTVSAFCGIGKCTAWKAWMGFCEVDEAFCTLATSNVIHQNTMKLIDRYVVNV